MLVACADASRSYPGNNFGDAAGSEVAFLLATTRSIPPDAKLHADVLEGVARGEYPAANSTVPRFKRSRRWSRFSVGTGQGRPISLRGVTL
jgi:hypothetical protein